MSAELYALITYKVDIAYIHRKSPLPKTPLIFQHVQQLKCVFDYGVDCYYAIGGQIQSTLLLTKALYTVCCSPSLHQRLLQV